MKKVWIWQNRENRFDEYVDFVKDFQVDDLGDIYLEISTNSEYVAYINGQFIGFGQYRDYPHYKVKDRIYITPYLKKGKNRLSIISTYIGGNFFVYAGGKVGLWFSVQNKDGEIACSDETTLSRISLEYESYQKLYITCQLGYTYHYHADKADGWKNCEEDLSIFGFKKSVVVETPSEKLYPRPIEKLMTLPILSGKLLQQGRYTYAKTERVAEQMQYADFAYRNFGAIAKPFDGGVTFTMNEEEGDGIYLLYDLEREDCGYLYLDVEAKEGTRIDIAYGEHLSVGRVASAIGDRNFIVQYTCGKDRQNFVGYFRRLGLRYLQLCVHAKEITVYEVGIQPVRYPQKAVPYQASNALRQKIYDTSVHTLELCMHEAYEDCPWREQALYNMDSRNQMLFSYYAFGDYSFAKSVLELMSQGVRQDGFLPICYPCGWDLPIPSFNLIYVTQVQEYVKHSGDKEFGIKKLDLLKNLLERFTEIREYGVLPRLKSQKGFWDFYEWQPTLSGDEKTVDYDCALTAFYAYALRAMANLCIMLDERELEIYYRGLLVETNQALVKNFYDEERGLFRTFASPERRVYSVLVNALCVLVGATDLVGEEQITNALLGKEKDVTPCTLSMSIFRYDALLRMDRKYEDFVLNDIDACWFSMLQKGATAFWETALGNKDFDGAGSLCHGWSALPIYYYHKLDKKANKIYELVKEKNK